MSDKILLQNMMFYGFHGVHEYEREQGQRFYLDVEMTLDVSQAAKSDDIGDTVDYTVVYSRIKDIVENRRFNLLEALGVNIAEMVLDFPLITQVRVKIRKPAVPIPGQIDFVETEIVRGR